MEQLVLGIFQEQLAKVIIGFRKEQVNANLLNGKGEIRDVSLNCDVLNKEIARICPYVRMEEIHVSRIGFHVTSWANLRKAPIIVNIGVVTAKAEEPFALLPQSERQRIQMITEQELIKKLSEGFKPFRANGSYGLVDRIVDNLMIEVELFRLEYQTWGKFKTRRPGPWTPPLLCAEMKNLKVCMVDAEGCEGSPDQVWAHNRGRRDAFLIYKKIYAECKVQLITQDPSCSDGDRYGKNVDLASVKMEVQLAVERRIRDGAVAAVQVDVTIPEVDIDIESSDIRQLVHFASGLQFCLAKDRSFHDPLKTPSEDGNNATLSHSTSPTLKRDLSTGIVHETEKNEVGDSLTDNGIEDRDEAVPIQDEQSSSSSDGEGDSIEEKDSYVFESSSAHSRSGTTTRARCENSVMILPGNLIIYKSVSLTFSVHELSLRGSYPCGEESGALEFIAKGVIGEAIWPKVNREHGFYMQLSTSFVSLHERMGNQKRTLLMGGMHRGDNGSRTFISPQPAQVCADDFFPLFERRCIREDPLDLRHLFPTQAFGLKTTVEIQGSSLDEFNKHTFMVHHEIGIDEIDIILDTSILLRMSKFIFDMDGKGFDPRWNTGDWSELLTSEMLVHPSDMIDLDEHLQECTELFLDENLMISSDLFNVTARLSNVKMRVPSVIQDSLRSCDIVLKWKETTFVISSALPRTFLTGSIGNSISGDGHQDVEKGVIDFPNDPSDICYGNENGLKGKMISTFRLQLTVRGFEVNVVPVIAKSTLPEVQKLIYISDSTMIFSFEGEPPTPASEKMKITVFLSVLIQDLIINIDLDVLAGALCTLLSHKRNIFNILDLLSKIITQYIGSATNAESSPQKSDETRIAQTIRGRRILAKRHMAQSRETGGLSIIFCLQQKELRLTIWRQNVPVRTPLRNSRDAAKASDAQDDEGCIDLVVISHCDMQELEIGIEFDFHSDSGHRVIVKSCVKSGSVKAIDLAEEIDCWKSGKEASSIRNSTMDANLISKRSLVDLCSFGKENMPSGLSPSGVAQHFAFRLEAHHRNDMQSWSMAADLSSPSTITLETDAVKNSIVLFIEGLLLPAWSGDLVTMNPDAPFPVGTIGAMFYMVFAELLGAQNLGVPEMKPLQVETNTSEPIVERTLRSLCKMFLPSNVHVILLRLEVANLLISVPSMSSGDREQETKLSFLLDQTDIVTRFYPTPGSPPSEIEHVLACKGKDWSTLINTNKEGFYQHILSRQSLLCFQSDGETSLKILVHPFEIDLSYSGSEVGLSMNKGISVDDIRLIEKVVSSIKFSVNNTSNCLSDLYSVLESITRGKQMDHDEQKSALHPCLTSNERKDCEEDLMAETRAGMIRSTLKKLQRANKEFSLYETNVCDTMVARADDIESMKAALFRKERYRFGALSMMSPRVAGWIRMGSQHRSGQRVVKKSILWPFWAVLRKELLLLYPRPADPQPTDVISLVNASIKSLGGGSSKQDTNKGFAIVECSGVARYFVAGNAQEYEFWTKEIRSTISTFCTSEQSEYMLDESYEDECHIPEDSLRNSRIGNRLSSAFQSAKLKTKEITDRRSTTCAPENSDSSSIFSSAIFGDSEMNHESHLLIPKETTSTPSKRSEIGKKLSGVGQVTKSKLGSALQNARQKREEMTNRRKSEHENGLSMDDESGGNNIQGPRGRMQLSNKIGNALQSAKTIAKGNMEKQSRLSNFRGKLEGLSHVRGDDKKESFSQANPSPVINHDEANENKNELNDMRTENVSIDTSAIIPSSVENDEAHERDSLQSDTIRSIASSFRSQDASNQDERIRRPSRFGFRRRQDDSMNDSLFGDDVLTLKNIFVENGMKSMPALDREDNLKIQLKIFEDKWMVQISERKSSYESRSIQDGKDESDSLLTASDVVKQNYPIDSQGLLGATEQGDKICCDHTRPDEVVGANQLNPNPSCFETNIFHFRVAIMRLHLGKTEVITEKTWTFGDVLKLYSMISEALEDDLPRLDRQLVENDTTDLEFGSNVLENLLVYGGILGGLLGAGESSEYVDGLGKYQCEVIEKFLNCMLDCPLPENVTMLLANALGIDGETIDFETNRKASGTSPSSEAEPTRTVGINSDEGKQAMWRSDLDVAKSIGGTVLNLLSACEADLRMTDMKTSSTKVPAQCLPRIDASTPHSVQIEPVIDCPILSIALTEKIHESMHEALTNVIAQRDEAYAQLMCANVIHTHTLERVRKKNEKLEIAAALSQDVARIHIQQDLQSPNIANMFGKPDEKLRKIREEIERKIERVYNILRSDDGDAEMLQLCHQLGAEIATKTSLASEVERLKEVREAEKRSQIAEKDALKEELRRVRELLEIERKKTTEVSADAAHWKSLYENAKQQS